MFDSGANGFLLKRIKGSHHIYAKPGLEVYVPVYVHGKEILKPETLQSIIKQAELNLEEFVR